MCLFFIEIFHFVFLRCAVFSFSVLEKTGPMCSISIAVSSAYFCDVSFSAPLALLGVALMPPWAATEWERSRCTFGMMNELDNLKLSHLPGLVNGNWVYSFIWV